MIKLVGNEIQKTRHLFEDFEFYQAVIFSIFEGQYNGTIYTDSREKPNWAILQTPFLQHVVAGNPVTGFENIVEEIFFTHILNEQTEKEIVAFYNDDVWDKTLKQIFEKHYGVSDKRKIFGFSLENYKNLIHKQIPSDVKVISEKCRTLPNALIDTWSSKVLFNDKIVSYCNALMVGKQMAEIDIATEEDFQGKGYATIASISLINNLLNDGITPCWATWPFSLKSQHIAQKLGFVLEKEVNAWIWLEEMLKDNV